MVICERFVNSRFTSNTYIIACSEHDNVWIVDPGDTEVVSDGYFHESEFRSAPYFDINIDGITILGT